MNSIQQFAIIGPTASGKTTLALEWARRHHGVILSLDSLALYRDIDIASAKPTPEERGTVPHFGLDLIPPDVPFDVARFGECYHQAYAFSQQEHRPLLLVGGSGFYLKTLREGISPLPDITPSVRMEIQDILNDLDRAYRRLESIDPLFAQAIHASDRYRIEKGLTIHRATGLGPSRWFATHPPEPIITKPLPVYEISVERSVLRQRIALRTDTMLANGLIDEVCGLERHYTRAPKPMRSIGIKEVLMYLDGRLDAAQMREQIIIQTARLAKRQVTFNKTQFHVAHRGTLPWLRKKILSAHG